MSEHADLCFNPEWEEALVGGKQRLLLVYVSTLVEETVVSTMVTEESLWRQTSASLERKIESWRVSTDVSGSKDQCSSRRLKG